MEKIYKPKTEKVIAVWEALAEYQAVLKPDGLSRVIDSNADIMEALGFPVNNNGRFDMLMQSIDVGQLHSDKDVQVAPFHPSAIKYCPDPLAAPIPEKAMKFKCVQNAVEMHKGKMKRNVEARLRYNKHRYTRKEVSAASHDLTPYQEMLLVLRFYEPFKYKMGLRVGHPKFSHEVYVLSSQFLTELKDCSFCTSDAGPFYEMSENRSAWSFPRVVNEETPKPGFFFIHDTFYNDLRHDSHHDYSEVILKWAERQNKIGELRKARMEETRFGDLRFRIGYPQLYQHQGNCEHLFVVSDCRLLMPSDVLQRSQYPLLNSYSIHRQMQCNICSLSEVQFVVRNSNRQIFDPVYLCLTCLESYHYKDGEKIGEFELYPYIQSRYILKE
ncbi:snRNA-activating protein complex subunit 3 [Anopheles darlingi]|uniref:snRNA-activating protein complex subunit 3 n=1 Tax=Anopheles darlingi TaxID=43151 RepID=W5JE93_ANODA|nr:snRNA-activating protein complex subunit 3 [Anopheles darlingi]XP_049530208.1 snRNA-activating protein complex subunit 3 [Anopheles darlingi]ETN61663.1 snRNA-activating protein complex subunit 3 [Anopheles darlingi]